MILDDESFQIINGFSRVLKYNQSYCDIALQKSRVLPQSQSEQQPTNRNHRPHKSSGRDRRFRKSRALASRAFRTRRNSSSDSPTRSACRPITRHRRGIDSLGDSVLGRSGENAACVAFG